MVGRAAKVHQLSQIDYYMLQGSGVCQTLGYKDTRTERAPSLRGLKLTHETLKKDT